MAPQSPHAPSPLLLLSSEEDQNSYEAEQRKIRKRLQNRRNQRLRRSRIQERNERFHQGPFKVKRWRLSDESSQTPGCGADKGLETVAQKTNGRLFQGTVPVPCSAWLTIVSECAKDASIVTLSPNLELEASLSQSHMHRLIKSNTFFALLENKCILLAVTNYFISGGARGGVMVPYSSLTSKYPGSGMLRSIMPPAPGPTGCLLPTPLQSSVEHSVWIDLIPFPRMRDNLIRREMDFDHVDLIIDVVGPETIDLTNFYRGPRCKKLYDRDGEDSDDTDSEDNITKAQTGLVVWGTPYDPSNWEITPGFLQKWGWTIEGCVELMGSTNRWRAVRGAGPLIWT